MGEVVVMTFDVVVVMVDVVFLVFVVVVCCLLMKLVPTISTGFCCATTNETRNIDRC